MVLSYKLCWIIMSKHEKVNLLFYYRLLCCLKLGKIMLKIDKIVVVLWFI